MRRFLMVVCLAVVLSGCSGGNPAMDQAIAFRESLLKAGGCRFQAEVTADYGDRLHTFLLDCSGDSMGNLNFSAVEPEVIRGIGGTIRNEGGELTFDDKVLFFPLMTDDQLSPVSAPWIFLKTLRSGCITAAGREEEFLRLTIDDSYEDNSLCLDIWLSPEGKPVRGDVLYDGKRFLSLAVTEFQLL